MIPSGLENVRHQVFKETHRFVLHEVLPSSLFLTNGHGGCAKRTVVEENTPLFETPKLCVGAPRRFVHACESNVFFIELSGRNGYGLLIHGGT